jgi:hypothetical protein
MNPIQKLRKAQASIYKIKTKYLDFCLESRSATRIQRFCKRKILFTPKNLTLTEISEIRSIYRYRTYIRTINYEEILDELFKDQLVIANSLENEIEKVIMLSSIEFQKNNMRKDIVDDSDKIPIMIDLSIYNCDPSIGIKIGDNLYYLSEKDKEKVLKIYMMIKPDTFSEIRFNQMLNWSKELCKTYNKKSIIP